GATRGDSRTGPNRSAPGTTSDGVTFVRNCASTSAGASAAAARAIPGTIQPTKIKTRAAAAAMLRRLQPSPGCMIVVARAQRAHEIVLLDGVPMMREPLLER